jgi:hypothetical protein
MMLDLSVYVAISIATFLATLVISIMSYGHVRFGFGDGKRVPFESMLAYGGILVVVVLFEHLKYQTQSIDVPTLIAAATGSFLAFYSLRGGKNG